MDRLEKLDLATKIKDSIINVLELNIDREELTDDVSLYSPIVQLDSLTLLHLLVTLEREFSIEIDDEDVMNADLTTVGSLIDMVQHAIAGDAGE